MDKGKQTGQKLYMANIGGWTEVSAFSADPETAKKNAIRMKKKHCKDDLTRWTWETVSEYYGAAIEEITDGTTLVRL